MIEKKTIAMTNDDGAPLFTWPSENPQLIGAKCKTCGEVVFPKRNQCPICYTETMEEVLLSTKGKVYSSAVTFLAPWSGFNKGKVPYEVAHVELPEKVLIATRTFPDLKTGDIAPLPIGTEVEMAIVEWGEDEKGNTVMMHTFRPQKTRA